MTQDDDLNDVIALRMRLARDVLDLAEEHREEVWERVCSRISSLADDPGPDLQRDAAPPPLRTDGPERRRRPTEPPPDAYGEPDQRAVRRQRLGVLHLAAAAIIAAAVVALIGLV